MPARPRDPLLRGTKRKGESKEMNFPRTEKYDKEFLKKNMMGPNSIMILEELLGEVPLKPEMRVLDLGCGNGLTSIFLAKEYGVQVFALDLWISATDNYRRFQEAGVGESVIPIHADARKMPFADGYFDAVVSVDAYHYVGNNDTFFPEKVRPLLKNDGVAAVSFPGMKYEVKDNVPEEMKPFWPEEALEMWHSIEWWKPKFEDRLEHLKMWEMRCFDQAWNDWLETDNPYAVGDRAMIRTDNGRYMNLIGITGRVE